MFGPSLPCFRFTTASHSPAVHFGVTRCILGMHCREGMPRRPDETTARHQGDRRSLAGSSNRRKQTQPSPGSTGCPRTRSHRRPGFAMGLTIVKHWFYLPSFHIPMPRSAPCRPISVWSRCGLGASAGGRAPSKHTTTKTKTGRKAKKQVLTVSWPGIEPDVGVEPTTLRCWRFLRVSRSTD